MRVWLSKIRCSSPLSYLKRHSSSLALNLQRGMDVAYKYGYLNSPISTERGRSSAELAPDRLTNECPKLESNQITIHRVNPASIISASLVVYFIWNGDYSLHLRQRGENKKSGHLPTSPCSPPRDLEPQIQTASPVDHCQHQQSPATEKSQRALINQTNRHVLGKRSVPPWLWVGRAKVQHQADFSQIAWELTSLTFQVISQTED